MNKKLFIQIWNERRSNTLLFIELLVISVVLWIVVEQLYLRYTVKNQPMGFDISHTYLLKVGKITDRSYLYDNGSEEWSRQVEDMGRLSRKIARDPEVEFVGLSVSSYPYSGSRRGTWMRFDTIEHGGDLRTVDPGFFRVFRLEGVRGETAGELAELLVGNSIFLSGEVFLESGIYNEQLRGECLYYGWDSLCQRVTGILKPIRYHDYVNQKNAYSFVVPLKETYPYCDITIRLKPDQEKAYLARMKKDIMKYKEGNIFLQGIRSFRDIRKDYLRDDDRDQTLYLAVMVFLLVNVFMSLLGVFAFRTRQRRKEIALQLAMGSTRQQAFTRLVSEGLILLLLATPPAWLINYYIAKHELWGQTFGFDFEFPTFFLTLATTWILVGLTIVVSIWFPARRAASVPPAEVLREE